jgi:hypothetical protein
MKISNRRFGRRPFSTSSIVVLMMTMLSILITTTTTSNNIGSGGGIVVGVADAVTADDIDDDGVDVDMIMDYFVRAHEYGVTPGPKSKTTDQCIETISEIYTPKTVHCFLDSCVQGPKAFCTTLLGSFMKLWITPTLHLTDVTAFKGHQWIRLDWTWTATDLQGQRGM